MASIVLLAACKDKRVQEVDAGITRDSVLSLIGKDSKGVDSLPNVYTRERYLIDGKNYEVFFFTPDGKHVYTGTVKDTIPWKDLEPIAMIDNRVAGKGWDFLDSLYAAHKIPLKKR
ncbi:MAG TPA: hypothetical protein VGP25_10510 [Gemmatimonadaceae bacterium]|nr:hypothetical protein [Gemmatimonadaceae bacterium]